MTELGKEGVILHNNQPTPGRISCYAFAHAELLSVIILRWDVLFTQNYNFKDEESICK